MEEMTTKAGTKKKPGAPLALSKTKEKAESKTTKTNHFRIAVATLAVAVAILLAAGTAQACACGPPVQGSTLTMTANPPGEVAVGEPLTFTVTKTNAPTSAPDWHVRDFLPEGVEFVSATPSQGSCALASRAELGISQAEGDGSEVVQCDLGAIPPGGSATIDITVTPTVPGEITNRAADNGESQASSTVIVG